jgi:hypothetical protein
MNLSPPRSVLNSLRHFRAHDDGPWSLSPGLSVIVNASAVLLLVTSPLWLFGLFAVYEEEVSIPLSTAASTAALILFADCSLIMLCSRQHSSLRRLMVVGLLAKVAAAGLYTTMVARLYNYVADMAHYFWIAQSLTTTYQQTGSLTFPDPLFGMNFPPFLGQCIFTITGISLPVAMLVFASMSYWGAYFFYRAFSIGFPGAMRSDVLAALIFLLPSCVFWTSSISKDAVMMLGSGIATYGVAHVYHRVGLRGYLLFVTGLGAIMTVRPHMAGILAIAFIFPHLFGANRTGLSGFAVKVIVLPALVVLTWFLVARGATYAEMQEVSGGTSVVMRIAQNNAATGGSTYGGSLSARLALAPFLLIRPFPFEVHNFQAALASLEGLGLLTMFWRRRKVLYRALGQSRSNPFAMFLALYTVEFTVIFAAATTNFGLLNRQRVMLAPFTIMLFLSDSRLERQEAPQPIPILQRKRRVAIGGRDRL